MTANPKSFADDQQKRIAYENACDCLYFGMGWDDWESNGLSMHDKCKVWHQAFYDMSDGCYKWLK